jgi:hypothetical protein
MTRNNSNSDESEEQFNDYDFGDLSDDGKRVHLAFL